MKLPHALLSTVTAEFRLMCLTARVDFSSEAAAQAAEIIASGMVDWSSFLSRVERHYIAPLVQRSLKSLNAPGVSAKVLDTLRVRSKITAFRGEMFAAELVRLCQLFESHGIRTIHYKGAVTAHEFYGSVTLRNFNDLDFLVHPDDLRAVVRLLEQQGYDNSEKLNDEQFTHYVREFKEFLFRRGDISLEPHWSLAGRRYPFDPDFEGFWNRSRTLILRNSELRVMSLEDSLLVLCLVGAKGRWKRLQMVTDLAACINRFTDSDWERVQQRAVATRTVRILHLGLLLAKELSGATLPPEIELRVYTDQAACQLAQQVTPRLMDGQKKSRWLPDTPSIFSRLLFKQRESSRDQLTYLWHTTTTPDLFHLQRMPLPKVARPLYRLLVPLHDLAFYPTWQLAKTLMRAL
jgi:hypothetical protein